MTAPATCTCTAALRPATGAGPSGGELLDPLLPTVLPWLTAQRWFTHENGCIQDLTTVSAALLTDTDADADADADAALLHLLADAHYRGADPRRYQILLGLRRALPAGLAHAAIGRAAHGPWSGWWLYEATADPQLMTLLLDAAATAEGAGALRLTRTGAPVPTGLHPRVLAVEQSNTSVVFGDQLLLKIFRQPAPGPHPETEVLTALTRLGSAHTPHLAAWLHTPEPDPEPSPEPAPGPGPGVAGGTDLPQQSTVLGIVEDFLPSDGDGWDLAVRQAAHCITDHRRGTFGIDGFTADSQALGESVAAVHQCLAAAFPTARLGAQQVLDQIADMDHRLQQALAAVPDLEPYRGRISAVYDEYAQVALNGRGLPGQRVHGDLHLGQVLRTDTGWMVIDFEGEPARPISERGLPQVALRDVAGMLRSFDYAAQHALAQIRADQRPPRTAAAAAENLRQERRAQAWTVRNRRAFCTGYAAAGGLDPRSHPIVMRAFETDKAVYEAAYEATHRPDWLAVPLAAIRRIITNREAIAAAPRPARRRAAPGPAPLRTESP